MIDIISCFYNDMGNTTGTLRASRQANKRINQSPVTNQIHVSTPKGSMGKNSREEPFLDPYDEESQYIKKVKLLGPRILL